MIKLNKFLGLLRVYLHLWSAEMFIRSKCKVGVNRSRHLDLLRSYRKSWRFPNNDQYNVPTPQLIGSNGNLCAVGMLMHQDGLANELRRLSLADNAVRIRDIDDKKFMSWAKDSGLTIHELGRIQPTYSGSISCLGVSYVEFIDIIWAISFGLFYFALWKLKSYPRITKWFSLFSMASIVTLVAFEFVSKLNVPNRVVIEVASLLIVLLAALTFYMRDNSRLIFKIISIFVISALLAQVLSVGFSNMILNPPVRMESRSLTGFGGAICIQKNWPE